MTTVKLERWRGHLTAAGKQGISLARYAREHGISRYTLYAAQRQLRGAGEAKPVPRAARVSRRSPFGTTIAALEGERAAWREQHQALQAEVRLLRVERDLYKERAEAIARRLFAAKSEQRGLQQRDLFFNEAEALAPTTTSVAKVRVPGHERAKRGRKPLDPALPREVIRYELPETERICPHDGSALKEIGVETSEQLDIVPAQVRVIRHERVKYACPCCSQGVHVAGAQASANLYSLIETAKANGVEPYRYLCKLFQALPAAKSVDDHEALLPWRLVSAA